MAAPVLELELGAEQHVPDSARYEHVPGLGCLKDPRGDMDGDACDVTIGELATTGVEPDFEVETQASDRGPEAQSTFDRLGRIVEDREEPVAGGLDLPSGEGVQLLADQGVVTGEDLTPPFVPEIGTARGLGWRSVMT